MSMVGNLKQVSTKTLHELNAEEIDVDTFLFSEIEEDQSLYIDKAWHALHYLLNESAWEGNQPLFDVILGGNEIGEDLGYGPARYLTHEEVLNVVNAITQLSGEELVGRYKPDKMTELDIYPNIDWDMEDEREYVFHYYWEVVEFYKDAAKKGNGMLLYIT